MRNHLSILTLVFLLPAAVACQPASARAEPEDLRTVENVAANSMPVEPPPMITEQATELRAAEPLGPDGKPIKGARATATPGGVEGDEEPVIEMPFAPLIAMDPVDGSKVSIRVGTPMTEFSDRLYYFGSEANRKAFLAEPEKYAKGSLSRY